MNKLKLLAMAALLVFPLAACDEDGTAPATGTISGSVTVEGSAQDGVTVTLSNGQSTTTAGGSYSFTGVEAGSYTVTISGFPSDASFPATSAAAVIASSGQTVTVDFSGSFIRTSAIFGSVTGAGDALAGVSVSLSGMASMSATTDAGGQYAFSGLRAGTYTVAISGFDSNAFSFSSTSVSVSVAAGETKVQNFSGTENRTAQITGFLYLDENDKNDTYDGAALEDRLAAAGIGMTLQGPDINTTVTGETAADGSFAFTELVAGSYNLIIDDADADIPSNVAFGGASNTVQITVTAGSTATSNFPFDITQQTISVFAFTGIDETNPGVAPVSGVDIELYPTDADAQALTNMIGTGTTDATGGVSFTFDRADDTSPASGDTDFVVFSVVRNLNNNDLGIQADSAMEIRYEGRTFTGTANDTVDILNGRATISFTTRSIATSIGGDEVQINWNTAFWLNDTTASTTQAGVTDANGMQSFTDGVAIASLPDTFFVRLSGTQPEAAGNTFIQTPEAGDDAMGAGQYLMYVHDGTAPVGTAVDLGIQRVAFLTQSMLVSVYHEVDDSIFTPAAAAGAGPDDKPTFTGGDNLENVDNVSINLWKVSNDFTDTSVVSTIAAAAGTGDVVFTNLLVDTMWIVSAFSTVGTQDVLNDTAVSAAGDAGGGSVGGFGPGIGGHRHSARLCPASNDTVIANCKTFAYKYNDNVITGVVRAADGTDADGLVVTVTPTAGNIQSNITSATATVTGGAYTITGLRDGDYDVAVSDSMGTWEFPSGGNTGASSLNIAGGNDLDIQNFTPTFMNTSIAGVVANDRDGDGMTLDPDEALAGVVIDAYDMSDSTMTTVASATTDANGAFSFGPLPEATYVLKRQAMTPDNNQIVLRALEADGSARDTAVVTTTAGAPNAVSSGLPAWTYNTSSINNGPAGNFTFLFSTTEIRGTVTDGTDPVANVQIFLRRCLTSTGSTSPPSAVGPCTTYVPGSPVATTTAADGTFSFTGLLEGVYEVAPNPPSVGLTTSAPVQVLYRQVGNGDIEEFNLFIVS